MDRWERDSLFFESYHKDKCGFSDIPLTPVITGNYLTPVIIDKTPPIQGKRVTETASRTQPENMTSTIENAAAKQAKPNVSCCAVQ